MVSATRSGKQPGAPQRMTAFAAALGLLPMLFGFGGSELEKPFAVVMVGGLLTSTLFTQLVLPSALPFTVEQRNV